MEFLAQDREKRPNDSAAYPLRPTSVSPTERCNLAIPRRGHVLATVSEEYGRPVRAAVGALSNGLQHQDCLNTHRSILSRRIAEPGAWIVRSPTEMLAWTLVSAWLTGVATGRVAPGADLKNGVGWFFAGGADGNPADLVPRDVQMKANEALAHCRDPIGYRELLPYVLDPHGPGSRLSIRRDAATRMARDRKRAEGIYYTPADVATYMTRQCLGEVSDDPRPRMVFDPACGTGVFLRAAVEVLKETFPEKSARSISESFLFGVDVDPWALDATAFVLLSECLADGDEDEVAPLLLWHRLRLNLACVDTLTLDPDDRNSRTTSDSKLDVVDALATGQLPVPDETGQFSERVPLSQLFPVLPGTGLAVVGNPPYSTAGIRSDFAVLGRLFETLGKKAGPGSDIYPLFLEQMVRLAPTGAAVGTLVLPLSLASNIRNQFVETRSFIEKTPGTWRFAFFDREPHALFGEDIKTRNSIIFWRRAKDEQETRIESGPLRKWRGDSRAAMFASIRFTPVVAAIRRGIPKIDGVPQARAFEVLVGRWDRFDHACANFRRTPLERALKNDRHTVFAGATAYNFLNVFLNPPPGVLADVPVLSEHPLHAMEFSTREEAAAAFGLLSSHLAFWWWNVTQDGFHVTARFLRGLPFGSDALSGTARETLAECGERLWSLIRAEPVVSLNRGRSSLAYSPNGFDGVRHEIDHVLADIAGLEPAFVIELQHFTAHTIRAEHRAVHGK